MRIHKPASAGGTSTPRAERQASQAPAPVPRTARTGDDARADLPVHNLSRMSIGPQPGRGESPAEPRRRSGASANITGLPNRLKSGVENLSGFAMDDVRLHFNSSKPAALHALAYTQGTDIHVAPGQERHLPHEAWHVAQQKQGRVKPTLQMKGVAINDDDALEREADAFGRAAQNVQWVSSPEQDPRPEGGAHTVREAQPIQRKLEVHRDTLTGTDKTNVDAAGEALDDHVTQATAMIKANPRMQGVDQSAHLQNWVAAFDEMLKNQSIPSFFYTRYGYAVEDLATDLMPTQFGNLTVRSQFAKGATRPDFAVFSGQQDIAWLDVTSAASKGHIFSKQHSGWKTRPYVAEVLYNPPKVADFSAGQGLSAQHQAAFSRIADNKKNEALNFQTGHDAIAVMLETALEDYVGQGEISKGATKSVVMETLKQKVTRDVTVKVTENVAGQVLACIELLTIKGDPQTGANWANWAFDSMAKGDGRRLIIEYGAKLRGVTNTAAATGSSKWSPAAVALGAVAVGVQAYLAYAAM